MTTTTPGAGRTGRPPKLTPEVAQRIVDAVRRGNYLETSAQHAGVDSATMRRWLAKGRRSKRGGDKMYRDFCAAVDAAMGEAERRDLERIDGAADPHDEKIVTRTTRPGKGKGSSTTVEEVISVRRVPGDWKAAAWKLERRNPDRWALVTRIRFETEKQINGLLEQLERKLPPATFRQVLDALYAVAQEADQAATASASATDDEADAM